MVENTDFLLFLKNDIFTCEDINDIAMATGSGVDMVLRYDVAISQYATDCYMINILTIWLRWQVLLFTIDSPYLRPV